jgi:hypothetical protein
MEQGSDFANIYIYIWYICQEFISWICLNTRTDSRSDTHECCIWFCRKNDLEEEWSHTLHCTVWLNSHVPDCLKINNSMSIVQAAFLYVPFCVVVQYCALHKRSLLNVTVIELGAPHPRTVQRNESGTICANEERFCNYLMNYLRVLWC